MALSKRQLEKLRKIVRLHVNWFVASILGDDALTNDERKELDKFKKLPKQKLNFVKKAFSLGRLKAILKKKEWSDLTWADLEEYIKSQKLSSLEKLVLQQADLSAAQHVKGLADDIAAGVFDQLARVTNQAISEASLKQMVKDEVKLAVLERKSYKELASSLAQATKTKYGKNWEKISRTELHSSKTAGTAQAIINKVDVFKHSQGIDSDVSIVPHSGTCPDCAKHYLDAKGNPKVFKLSKLMGAGSNADPGVSHKKKNYIHLNWKTTLPPLHPNCRCELRYIPPGYSWVNGTLKVTDRAALVKAIGDSKLSATAKPQGPDSAKAELPAPPATPGMPSPAQDETPKTAGATSAAGPTGPEVEYVPKEKSPKRPPGAVGETENSWKVIPGAKAGKPLTPEQERAKKKEQLSEAKAWNKEEHPHQKVLDHISGGKIALQEPLSKDEAGQFESWRVTIEGNGQAMMKPPQTFDDRVTMGDGYGTAPAGTGHKREAAAYSFAMALGLQDHIPPTVTRSVGGKEVSMQQWMEGYAPASKVEGGLMNALDKIEDPDIKAKAMDKLQEVAVLGIVMNHGDQHFGNILYNPDTHDIMCIDNSSAFGQGMIGSKSQLALEMHKKHKNVTIPEHLQEKMRRTTFGDLKRSMGEHLSDDEIGQHYMRMQYMLHLQDTEGKIDFDKVRGTQLYHDKKKGTFELRARPGYWGDPPAQHEYMPIFKKIANKKVAKRLGTDDPKKIAEHIQEKLKTDPEFMEEMMKLRGDVRYMYASENDPEFLKADADRVTPPDLFDSFCHDWIQKRKSEGDPRGEQMSKLKIVQEPGAMFNDQNQAGEDSSKEVEARDPSEAHPAKVPGSGAGEPKGSMGGNDQPTIQSKLSSAEIKASEEEGKAEAAKLQAMTPKERIAYRRKQDNEARAARGEGPNKDSLLAKPEERPKWGDLDEDLQATRKAGPSLFISGETLQKAFTLDTEASHN